MNLDSELSIRSNDRCELCDSTDGLVVYAVPPKDASIDTVVHCCSTCLNQLENPNEPDPNHWRCLNDSMWSQVSAVQVVAWRMLNRLKEEGWPMDLLDMLYLDDATLAWAKESAIESEAAIKVIDSNGAELQAGDTVVLVKDLNVKGAGITAKRGIAVRNIGLVHDDPEYIQGRVEGQQIYILTKFVKKN